jgi:hypothetical protein
LRVFEKSSQSKKLKDKAQLSKLNELKLNPVDTAHKDLSLQSGPKSSQRPLSQVGSQAMPLTKKMPRRPTTGASNKNNSESDDAPTKKKKKKKDLLFKRK